MKVGQKWWTGYLTEFLRWRHFLESPAGLHEKVQSCLGLVENPLAMLHHLQLERHYSIGTKSISHAAPNTIRKTLQHRHKIHCCTTYWYKQINRKSITHAAPPTNKKILQYRHNAEQPAILQTLQHREIIHQSCCTNYNQIGITT